MAASVVKYDTSVIREEILKQYGSYAEFIREYCEKYGGKFGTISTNIEGRYAPSPEVAGNLAKMLGLSSKIVSKCYTKKIKVEQKPVKNTPVKKVEKKSSKKSSKSSSKKAEKKPDVIREFNYEKLEGFVNKSGMSKNKITTILGISVGTFCAWRDGGKPNPKILERLCSLLSIKMDDIFDERVIELEPVAEEPAVEDKTEKPVEPAVTQNIIQNIYQCPPLIPSLEGFKTIEASDNIYERMDIINNNILLLVKMLSEVKPVTEPVVETTAAPVTEAVEADEVVAEVATGPEKSDIVVKLGKPKKPVAVVKKEEAETKEDNPEPEEDEENDEPELDTTNTDDLYFEKYVAKINNMVTTLSRVNKCTYNNTMHNYYTQLNKEYGIVYDQLRKDYVKDTGKQPQNTLKQIYHDKKVRQIFYNIIATDYSHVKKK